MNKDHLGTTFVKCLSTEIQGDTHDIDLPPDVLASVVGQTHTSLSASELSVLAPS